MMHQLPRPFLRLVWSNLAAQSAEQLGLAAVPIVAVLALGAGPGEIGLLATAQTLPFLILSMPLGLLADRTSRRQLMALAEGLRLLAAVLSASAVALLLGLNEPKRLAQPARHPLLELQDGARLVWRHALLRPILLTAVAWNISWFVLQAAYVPYAVRTLGLSAGGVGITLASYGAGMIVGALFAPRVMGALPFGRAIQVGPTISVLAAMTMVATLAFPSAAVAVMSFFLFGVGPIIWTITATTLRQTVTPNAMLGRVSALFLTVNMGARPLGAALGGFVGAAWGEPACLILALLGFILQAWLIFASPVSHLQHLPEPIIDA